MAKIIKKGDKIQVPDTVTIPFIEGDGVGAEITPICKNIVEAAVKKCFGGKRKVEWMEVLAGEKAFKQTGSWLPAETMDIFKEYLIGIKGPLATPVGGGIRSLNVAMRQELDLYVCLRPVAWFKGVASPLKEPWNVDMTVFRENTEDIYAGIEWEAGTPEAAEFYGFLKNKMGVKKVRFPETSSFGVKPVSKEGSQRLVLAAVKYAVDNKLPSVTIVHKGNIMKFTEGGFKRWGYAAAEREFGDFIFTMEGYDRIKKDRGASEAEKALTEAKERGKVILKDCIADAFLQNTLLKPKDYSVIATLNLNGDYISDQLAAMVGGIGIAPGGNINFHTGHAIFEATHGTAPDIAGKNIVNPSSMLLSFAMLMDHIGWAEVSGVIKQAMEKSFEEGFATADLARFMENGKPLSSSGFGEYIAGIIENGNLK